MASSRTATPPPAFVDSTHNLVPAYSATDDASLYCRIEQAAGLTLPILRAPTDDEQTQRIIRIVQDRTDETAEAEAFYLERDIVNAFFSAIAAGHDDIVADFVSRGFVSPDVTSRDSETPLLAAVRAGKTPMVSRLVALGATVNAFGASASTSSNDCSHPQRTPLQLAAEQGHLALVRVLMEDYGADDSLVAPDGAIALRLAAANGHRDIVSYLPSRRAGAWLRWKTAHQKEMKRVRRAFKAILRFVAFFIWDVPKAIVYDLPKEIGKSVWKRRRRIAAWCKRKAVELPARIKKEIVELPGHIKDGAKEVWKGVKKIPGYLKRLFLALWKFIARIPSAIKAVILWIGRGLRTIGESVFHVLGKLVSLLHTAIVAVLSFFRSITAKDVWDAFCYLVKAVFVETPKAIFKFIKTFGKMSYEALGDLFGFFGKALWYLLAGILWLVQYIPKKLWQCVEALGRSTSKAFSEILAFLDPKRM